MKLRFIRLCRAARVRVTLLTLTLAAGHARAGLPPVVQPNGGGGGGGTYNTVMAYVKMAALGLGLLVCVGAFLAVAHAVITSFHDVRKGKGTWTEFVLYCVVGIILILVVIYLATQAADIL
ncbi:integrating conjugative element membrane protein (TIGR03745 family) [Pantoea sp. PA1]|uniref:TIGR03745 family integrating conjugative element membrane protein n=1 Tax=Pantoea TaxID=53335 RepID=UPI0006A1BB4D|nr:MULTISPECIES: TIGR03745 family integrating conjugative element membrane protein [Pantoea]KNA27251.1 conjugal transfer protein [Pantoea ananatis]NQE78242.1 integrating conjugative element membrane protein [Pantoea ananatis]NQE83706.1 integrating conjugative element membrane protein [Pantoea ananatis]PQL00951.1 TIGR03745 family integrating conjugative element membrane protein [Pantoea ananatis]